METQSYFSQGFNQHLHGARPSGDSSLDWIDQTLQGSTPNGDCSHATGPCSQQVVEGIAHFFLYITSGSHVAVMEMLKHFKEKGVTSLPKETAQLLAAIGTNQLTSPVLDTEQQFYKAYQTARVLNGLEAVFMEGTILEAGEFLYQSMKKFDSRKGLVKFFSKRIPCRCLDAENQRTKSDTSGLCSWCSKVTEDTQLFDCGGCRLIKYCSVDCQTEGRSVHRGFCKPYRKLKRNTERTKKQHYTFESEFHSPAQRFASQNWR